MQEKRQGTIYVEVMRRNTNGGGRSEYSPFPLISEFPCNTQNQPAQSTCYWVIAPNVVMIRTAGQTAEDDTELCWTGSAAAEGR